MLDGGAASSERLAGLCKTGPADEELKPEQVQGKATGYIQEVTNLFYEIELVWPSNMKTEKGYSSL